MDNKISYDYIIIGAGSSGCAVASRLSESLQSTVLLIEAGPNDGSWKINMPLGYEYLVTDSEYNWQYQSEPETGLKGRRIDHPRGKVIGGSSSINGMVYTRGHALDYDNWNDHLGCTGWAYQDVLPYFMRSETYLGGESAYRGKSGPLKVTRPDLTSDPLNRAFIEAGKQAGYLITPDSNSFQQEGFGANERTTWNGRRWSAARAYLSPEVRKRKNLKILSNALVERIIISNNEAQGVQISSGQSHYSAQARKEVILCAGVFGSPQLLQLSGIGDPKVLDAAGVPVIHNLRGVGRNLQDHPDVITQYQCTARVGLRDYTKFPLKQLTGIKWFISKTGVAASNQFEAAAYLRSAPGIKYPDLKLEMLSLAVDPHTFKPHPYYGFQFHISHLRPESRGTVLITSPFVQDKPEIRFNYLSTESDRAFYRNAVRITRELILQSAFSGLGVKETSPGISLTTDQQLNNWVAQNLATAYHPVGTCRMGRADDIDSVLTPDLKVRGIRKLRVADASIMPQIVSSNTNAPTIMIGELAADLIQGKKLSPMHNPYFISKNWKTSQKH